MAAKLPRLRVWRERWHVVWLDPASGKDRRRSCGNRNADQRKDMLREIQRDVEARRAEAFRQGGLLDYDRSLSDALGDYLADVEERENLRAKRGGREGLAAGTAEEYRNGIARFRTWIGPTVNTGSIDAPRLKRYFNLLAMERKSATVNAHRRTLRAAFRWLAGVRPRLFPDPESLWPAFKQAPVERREAVAFTPAELRGFMAKLSPDQKRLFRFLALTGCRLGEALSATWDGVDLERGRILLDGKTGKRILPLVNAPEIEIAPKLLAAMRSWKKKGYPPAGADRHHRDGWNDRRAREKGGERTSRITPQALRRNFTSYAASLNVPPMVCAMWQGHSVQIAQKYYAQQVLERLNADSIEGAMGL